MTSREFGSVGYFIRRVVVFAGRCVAAPFRVIGRELHTAVAFPAFGNAVNTRLGIAGGVVDGDLRHTTIERRHLAQALGFCFVRHIFLAHRCVCFIDTKFFARRFFEVFVEKRVLVEHLLDLLAQFEGGELEQTDRLLQLRREGQVLRDAKGESLLHGQSCITFGNVRRDRRGAHPRSRQSQAAYLAPARDLR